MQFAPHIERWRPLAAKYIRPEDLDKFLWLIQWESSGDPDAQSDSGGFGLTQLNDGGLGEGLSIEQRLDPETNIRTAARAIYGGQGWKPWGENNLYNGEVFGSLGNHPFPGGTAASGGGAGAGAGGQARGGAVNGRAPTAPSWTRFNMTQGFGPTDEPLDSGYNGYAHFNKGYDYGIPEGTDIDAAASGVVVAAHDEEDGWGISVKVRDDEGNLHSYGHLSGVNVTIGDRVERGQVVGRSGNTGASTGAHLSYDVKDANGNFIDPGRWVSGERGNANYSGPSNVPSGMPPLPKLPFDEKTYQEKYTEYKRLMGELWAIYGEDGQIPNDGVDPSDPRFAQFYALENEVNSYETAKDNYATDFNTYLAGLDYANRNAPGVIDATNAANKWARELEVNTTAMQDHAGALSEQRLQQDAAEGSLAAYKGSDRSSAGSFRVPSTALPSTESMFAKSLERVRANLPTTGLDLPYARQIPTTTGPVGGAGASVGQGPRPATRPSTPAESNTWQGPINPAGDQRFAPTVARGGIPGGGLDGNSRLQSDYGRFGGMTPNLTPPLPPVQSLDPRIQARRLAGSIFRGLTGRG